MLKGKGLRKFNGKAYVSCAREREPTGIADMGENIRDGTNAAASDAGGKQTDVDFQKRDPALAYLLTSIDYSCKGLVRTVSYPAVA